MAPKTQTALGGSQHQASGFAGGLVTLEAEVVQAAQGTVDLTQAEIIVAGGRGLGSKEKWCGMLRSPPVASSTKS